MTKGFVYITLEMAARELDSKAIVAEKLARNGYTVIFGQQWAIFRSLHQLPRGSILFKGYNKIYWSGIVAAKNLGYSVFVMDEENFLDFSSSVLEEVLDNFPKPFVDGIFLAGENERIIFERKAIRNTICAGNPRQELLGESGRLYFRKEIEEITREHPNYILINTNFGTINSLWGDTKKAEDATRQYGVTKNLRNFLDAQITRESYAFNVINEFITKSDDSVKIIIRPHPAENMDFYLNQYKDRSNIKVIRSGHHVPWTACAKAVVHSNCLTGLEARFFNVPSVSIMDRASLESDSLVTKHCHIVHETGALIEFIDHISSTSAHFDLDAMAFAFRMSDPITPSDIYADVLGRASEASFKPSLNVFKIIDFGLDVPQLLSKCNLEIQDIRNALSRSSSVTGGGEELSVIEVSSALFLIHSVNNPIELIDETGSPAKLGGDTAASAKSDWDYTGDCKHGVIYAERLWSEGDIQTSIEVLDRIYKSGYDTKNLVSTYGTKLSALGFTERASHIFSRGVIRYPKDASLRLNLAKTLVDIAPSAAYLEIERALNLSVAEPQGQADIYRQGIEYLGFAARRMQGRAPYHAIDRNDMNFDVVRDHAGKFYDLMRAVWSHEGNRNLGTYELTALSQFAYGGLPKLEQFLVKLSSEAKQSVWASVVHWDSDSRYYADKPQKLPGQVDFSGVNLSAFIENKALFISCDTRYFQKYGTGLLKSLRRAESKYPIYVHLMYEDKCEINGVRDYVKKFEFDCKLITEEVAEIEPSSRRVYYHISRFFRLHQLLESGIHQIYMLDVDALFRNNPSRLFSALDAHDIAIRARSCRLHPWNQLNASVVGVTNSDLGRCFIRTVANYLARAWINGTARWGLDQVGLFLVYEYLIAQGVSLNVRYLNDKQVDYDYSEFGVVWQNSGASKFMHDRDQRYGFDETRKIERFNRYAQAKI